MRQIAEFVDERQKAWCIHCAREMRGLRKSRDHVPSKVLLRKPYATNLPVVEICSRCNAGFAKDEEYVAAFVSAALSGSTEPVLQRIPQGRAILGRSAGLRTAIEAARQEYRTTGGEVRSIWRPEVGRFSRVVTKNARGHALYEFGEPMLGEPDDVGIKPLAALTRDERVEFEDVAGGKGWPEVGSRMLSRSVGGQDLVDDWVVVQGGVYRYAVIQDGGVAVRTVIAEYLAVEVRWDQ